MLRILKASAVKTFRDISAETGYSTAALTAACRGERLPSWALTRAFVMACHGDEQAARVLYIRACREQGREVPGPDLPAADSPDPAKATTPTEFAACMRQLRLWAGNPSLATLNARSGGHLPPSTLSSVLRREALPRLDLLSHFVRACGLPADRAQDWEAAWKAIKELEELPAEGSGGQEGQPRMQPAAALPRRPLFPRKVLQALVLTTTFTFTMLIIASAILVFRVLGFLHPVSTARSATASALDLSSYVVHPGQVASVMMVSSDGKTLLTVASDGTISIWDVASNRRHPASSPSTSQDVSATAADGNALTVKAITGLSRDVTTRPVGNVVATSTTPLYSIRLTPDGKALASGALENTAQLWNMVAVQEVQHPAPRPARSLSERAGGVYPRARRNLPNSQGWTAVGARLAVDEGRRDGG
jgi:hypothetical protein